VGWNISRCRSVSIYGILERLYWRLRVDNALDCRVAWGGKSLVRLDKWTWMIGGLALAAAVGLGAWAGIEVGPWAGVLAALAGLVSAVLWQAAANRRSTPRSR